MNLGLGLSLCYRSAALSSPTQLSGCRLWLRSDLGITTSGGEVTAWADQSGAGDANRNFTPRGTDKPTYNASVAGYNNRPTVGSFNVAKSANDVGLKSGVWNATYNAPLTIIVVGHGLNDGTNRYFCSEAASDFLALMALTGGLQSYTGNGPTVLTAAGALGSNVAGFVGMVEINGASSALYANRLVTPNQTGTCAASTLGNAGYTIGTWGGASLATTYGCEALAEIIIYDRILPDAEKVQLRGYLNALYGKAMTQ